jgi:biopolymer transport protein ExbB
MISGIIIVACIFVGWNLNFIMGNGANFEGGVNRSPVTRKYVSNGIQGGPIVPVLLGLLLMVVVFSFERYAVISKGWFRKP